MWFLFLFVFYLFFVLFLCFRIWVILCLSFGFFVVCFIFVCVLRGGIGREGGGGGRRRVYDFRLVFGCCCYILFFVFFDVLWNVWWVFFMWVISGDVGLWV